MSKRQRFFVELVHDQVTMVSWKQLLAEGKRITTSETTAPSTKFPGKAVPGLNHTTSANNLNATESNSLKSRKKLKLAASNSSTAMPVEQKPSLDERTLITYTSRQIRPKATETRIREAKVEFGEEDAVVTWTGPKGKVHRSMPAKTSCRTKKKTRVCFCCAKPSKDPETQA